MKTFKPHVTEAKKKEVEEVKKLFNEYPVAGIVNLENLPTLQLQRIKKRFKTNAEVYGVPQLTSDLLIREAHKFIAIDEKLLLKK